MFDEPLSRLDIQLRQTMRTQIKEILERLDKPTVIVTHDQIEALTMAGRIFLPEAKRILVQIENATNLARRTWRGEAGVLRLGYTATAAFVDLPLILKGEPNDLSIFNRAIGRFSRRRDWPFPNTPNLSLRPAARFNPHSERRGPRFSPTHF